MTAIIGIKTNSGPDKIIIGADTQLNEYKGEKATKRAPVQKIHSAPGANWVIAYAGTVTDELRDFYGWLLSQKGYNSSYEKINEAVQQAVKSKRFMEVDELNAKLRKRGVSIDEAHSFLLGVKSPMELYYVDQYGNMITIKEAAKRDSDDDFECIRELECILLGSGAETMGTYLKAKFDEGYYELPQNITSRKALEFVVTAIGRAHKRDSDSGACPDLAIIRDSKIIVHTKRFGNAVYETITNECKKIIEEEAAEEDSGSSSKPESLAKSADPEPSKSSTQNV